MGKVGKFECYSSTMDIEHQEHLVDHIASIVIVHQYMQLRKSVHTFLIYRILNDKIKS